MKIFIFLMLLPILCLSQPTKSSSEVKSSLDDKDEFDLEEYKRSNYIKEYTPIEKGIDISEDDKRFSIAYMNAMMPQDFGTFTSLEAMVGIKYSEIWMDFLVARSSGEFGTVGFNSTDTTTSESEGVFQRGDTETVDILQLGMGPTLQSRFINSLFGTDNFYEYSTAYATYAIAKDSFREETFSGLGLRTDFTINYRYSSKSHIGFRTSYRLYPVKRSAKFDGEGSDERSLIMSWLSAGFDLTYFF